MSRDMEPALEAIRARREVRDRMTLQHSIPLMEQLRNMVQEWIDGEFKDLEDLIGQVDSFAPSESASNRINKYRIELSQIRSAQLPNAIRDLNELIDYVKKQEFESVEEATRLLGQKISSILSVISGLGRARDRLDGMADMIQIPLPTPIDLHPEDAEEE
jgi:hypothetical protein